MNKPFIRQRPLPTKFTGVISTDWFRKFAWHERLKILCGFNLNVSIRIVTQHTPGKYNPVIMAETSKHQTPSAHVEECLRDILEKQNKAGIVQ